jgi:uncharacterized protein
MSKIVHFEIPADDTTRAKQFWASLFDVEFKTYEGPIEYHMFQNDDQTGGGLYPRQEGEQGLITYFAVDDIDAARAKVQELGGTSEDKAPVPGMGWYARAVDTEGNAFSLWQTDETAPEPEPQTSEQQS